MDDRDPWPKLIPPSEITEEMLEEWPTDNPFDVPEPEQTDEEQD